MLLPGCGSPRVALDAVPRDVDFRVDGRPVPVPLNAPVPYHGVADLAAVPPPTGEPSPERVDQPRLAPARRRLDMAEPVTPWIFPLDFVVELAIAPFVGDPVHRAVLVLPTRTDVPVTSYEPLDLEALRSRAEVAAIQR
jgi:hypothetical protein